MGVYRMRYWLHQMSNIWLWLISMNFSFCWFLAISADYLARNRQEMNGKLKSAWFEIPKLGTISLKCSKITSSGYSYKSYVDKNYHLTHFVIKYLLIQESYCLTIPM